MEGKKKTIIWVTLLLVVVVLGIGYAAISTIGLNINATGQATPNSENFTVEFSGEPSTEGKGSITAEIDSGNKLMATMDVTGLTAKGDTATATYTIENKSADLSANLTVAEPTNDNTDYFKVTYELAEDTIAAGASTTIQVKVELIKTPIDENQSVTSTVAITATPVQP